MTTTSPQWPFLVRKGNLVYLESHKEHSSCAELGRYCGEWGSYVDGGNKPTGIRLMGISDELLSSPFTTADNIILDGGDLIVRINDDRLPDTDCCPCLPIYLARSSDGRSFIQLSGLETRMAG